MGNEVVKKLPIDWNAEKGDGTIAPAPCAPAAQMGVYVWKCLGCPNCRGFVRKDVSPYPRPVDLDGSLAHSVRCAHPSFQAAEPEPLRCVCHAPEITRSPPPSAGGAARISCRRCGIHLYDKTEAGVERLWRAMVRGMGKDGDR